MTETDESLAAAVAQGNERALRTLHARYAPLVFTVAARVVNASGADDVVQDVFVTIWRKAATFDAARGSFKSWVVQIARRRALNELRHRRVRPADGDDALAEVAADGVAADDAQWAAHRREVLRRAIDALPDAQRQALSLAFFEELSHEQVASVLRLPLGTAKTRIRAALRRVAPALLALIAAIALVAGWRREDRRRGLEERALRLVTASDVTPIRLEPSPGASPQAHGTVRAKKGADVAVVTATDLPALAPGEHYAAWIRQGGRWALVGVLPSAEEGRSVLVTEGPAFASAVDEIRVTRETIVGTSLRGPVVLAWPAEHER